MNENEWEFRLQEQFGRAYNPNDCIIFSVSMHFPEAVVSISLLYSYYIFLVPLAAMTLDLFDQCKKTRILRMDWWSKNDHLTQSVCYFSAFIILIILIYVRFFAQSCLKVCRLLCRKWPLLWCNHINYSAASVRCFYIISDKNICISHIGIAIINWNYTLWV